MTRQPSSSSSTHCPPHKRYTLLPTLFLFFTLLSLLHIHASSTTCESLDAFYADTSLDQLRLRKFTRSAGRLASASSNKPLRSVVRTMKKTLKRCKSSQKSTRMLNVKNVRPVQLRPRPKTNSLTSALLLRDMLGEGPASVKMATKKRSGEKKSYTEADMTKACNKLRKRAARMSKAAVMSGLFSKTLATDELPAPKGVGEVSKEMKKSDMSVSDVYQAVSVLMQSVPNSDTTCTRLCPCAAADTVKGVCGKPQSPNFDGDCAVAGSKCTVKGRKEVSASCGDSMTWKYSFTFNGEDGKEVCHYFNDKYYCDRSSPFACVGGVFSQRNCCLAKCGRKLCVDRVDLYSTLGVKSDADPNTCVLKSLAADLSYGTRLLAAECKQKCEELFAA